jgi:TetR/AcrR family fatty acid metabolism transcriptional regulator
MVASKDPADNGKRPRELEVSVASQRRRQIMQGVMDCISDYGLEHTTMRTVAQRAGVSTGTLAYYFKSKKELVDAALLDASQKYMERFNVEKGGRAPGSLGRMVDQFLARDNTDAGIVLQMIEVGLHNAELRGTHQEMIEAGRVMIEYSIRDGIEAGVYRADIDPKLTAALLHGVLIWWGSELIWNATSEELAREVSRMALRLLEKTDGTTGGAAPARSDVATPEAIRSLLVKDPLLDPDDARSLSEAIEKLYGMASRGHDTSQAGQPDGVEIA